VTHESYTQMAEQKAAIQVLEAQLKTASAHTKKANELFKHECAVRKDLEARLQQSGLGVCCSVLLPCVAVCAKTSRHRCKSQIWECVAEWCCSVLLHCVTACCSVCADREARMQQSARFTSRNSASYTATHTATQ